jgi:hypothetical protein
MRNISAFLFLYDFSSKIMYGTILGERSDSAIMLQGWSRRFETRWGKLIFFSIYLILPAALGPRVHLASNGNKYQKHKINNVSGK